MAKKKKEEPKVDNETGSLKVKEKLEAQPTGNETKGNVTAVKAKMKQKPVDLSKETITKVNLEEPPKPKENEIKEETPEDTTNDGGVVELVEDTPTPQKQEEVQPEVEAQETPIVEEITNEEKVEKVEEVEEIVTDAIIQAEETGTPLPENVQKLMNFMEETGGDLQDYVKLNQDYSEMDNQTLLNEYYKQTKPHLTNDEIEFVMEDQFSYDEELEEEKDIKRKKLARQKV